eukprot:7796387-Alexandrium_andersonii.AAC.1
MPRRVDQCPAGAQAQGMAYVLGASVRRAPGTRAERPPHAGATNPPLRPRHAARPPVALCT